MIIRHHLLGLVVTAIPFAGCAVVHSSKNAPGNTDIMKPPSILQNRAIERPEDPGENVIIWNAGALGGGGVTLGGDGAGQSAISGETSVHMGSTKYSHPIDSTVLPGLPVSTPDISYGLTLGGTLGTKSRSANRAAYAEFEVSSRLLYSLSGGWAWDPGRQEHGPQFTGGLGPLYLRSTTMLGRSTSLEIGLIFKLPVLTYTWSQ